MSKFKKNSGFAETIGTYSHENEFDATNDSVNKNLIKLNCIEKIEENYLKDQDLNNENIDDKLNQENIINNKIIEEQKIDNLNKQNCNGQKLKQNLNKSSSTLKISVYNLECEFESNSHLKKIKNFEEDNLDEKTFKIDDNNNQVQNNLVSDKYIDTKNNSNNYLNASYNQSDNKTNSNNLIKEKNKKNKSGFISACTKFAKTMSTKSETKSSNKTKNSSVNKLKTTKRLDSLNSVTDLSIKPKKSDNSTSSKFSSNNKILLATPSFDCDDNLNTQTINSSNDISSSSTNKIIKTTGQSSILNSLNKKTLKDKNSLNSVSEEELNCAFQLLDVNNDGSISKQELKEMLLSLNIMADDELINEMILKVSSSETGLINKSQFKELMINFTKAKDKEDEIDKDLWAAFQVFDRDQNGYITKDELQLAMKMMGEQFTDDDINTLMRLTDLDNDGKISFSEFKLKFRMLT